MFIPGNLKQRIQVNEAENELIKSAVKSFKLASKLSFLAIFMKVVLDILIITLAGVFVVNFKVDVRTLSLLMVVIALAEAGISVWLLQVRYDTNVKSTQAINAIAEKASADSQNMLEMLLKMKTGEARKTDINNISGRAMA